MHALGVGVFPFWVGLQVSSQELPPSIWEDLRKDTAATAQRCYPLQQVRMPVQRQPDCFFFAQLLVLRDPATVVVHWLSVAVDVMQLFVALGGMAHDTDRPVSRFVGTKITALRSPPS